MKSKLMLAASALAIMTAMPAQAQMDAEPGAGAPPAQEDGIVQGVREGLESADSAMRDAADEVRAFLVGEDMISVTADASATADGMIGETIVNQAGESVAEVEDVIVDKNGVAQKVVVSDGGLLGIGSKHAAFDYDTVVTQQEDGSVIMRISEDMIDAAQEFAYEGETSAQTEIMRPGHLSVNEILDGKVHDSTGKKVADIDNLTFDAGRIGHVIVTYGQVLGLGGEQAALDFDSLEWTQADGEVNARLTASQSAEFEQFREARKG